MCFQGKYILFIFISRPRSSGLVPNTNKHAVEANPVWMTDAAYNNMSFREEDDSGKIIFRSRTIAVITERDIALN